MGKLKLIKSNGRAKPIRLVKSNSKAKGKLILVSKDGIKTHITGSHRD